MKSIALLAVAVAAFPLAAAAAEKFATTATVEKDKASLTISSADCADNPECEVATLSCGDTAFSVSVSGVETSGAVALVKTRKATLTVDAKPLPLLAQKLQFSEMDGAWEVELSADESGSDAWKALTGARKVTLSVGGRTIVFPGDKNLAKVAKTCAH